MNPFHTFFGLNLRSTRLMELSRRDGPLTRAYQIWAAGSVNDAYGNPAGSGVGGSGCTALFQVPRGGSYRSVTLKRTRRGFYEGNRRGSTFVVFDPEDFTAAGVGLPTDSSWWYLRTQEDRGAGFLNIDGDAADPVLGPIYCVPPASVFGQMYPSFFLTGLAPLGTNCVDGQPPLYNEDLTDDAPRPLHLVFPRLLETIEITNTGEGVGGSLLVSFGSDGPMTTLTPGEKLSLSYNAAVKQLVLAAVDQAATYRVTGALGAG